MSASAPPPPPDPRHPYNLEGGCLSSPCRPAVRRAKTVANPESLWRREPLTDVTNEVLGSGANPHHTERRLQRVPIPLDLPLALPTPTTSTTSPSTPSTSHHPILRLRRAQTVTPSSSSSPLASTSTASLPSSPERRRGRRAELPPTGVARVERVGELNPGTRRTRSSNPGATRRGLPVLVEDENSESEAGEGRRSSRRRRTAGGSGFR